MEERIPTSRLGVEFVVSDAGLEITSPRSWLRTSVIALSEITHFSANKRWFWLGTTRDIMSFSRRRFRDEDGPERLSQALCRAIARKPHGLEQLAKINQINGLARQPAPQWAARILALVCVLVYFLQYSDPFIEEVASFVPEMVSSGQLWRLVSANFLHGPIWHLLFNLLGLLGLAVLVERPLGSGRTAIVMAAAGVMAMLTSYLAEAGIVVGVSGVVMGLAGAAMCLEFHNSDRLPVWWRVPRAPFVTLMLIELAIGFSVPFIAGPAHFGGFVGGYLATRLLVGGGVMRRPIPPWMRRVGAATAFVVLLALVNVALLITRESNAMERYAKQLLATSEMSAYAYNSVAWRMATESSADVEQLGVAQDLAEAAADRTEHYDPQILDTLAEVLFSRGDVEGALRTIDEAIRLTNAQRYYVEQRRRFTGERAVDDRPDPPPRPLRVREVVDDGPEGILI
ncbi:MAG: membrane associated rhomboid family serine protease [Myxococcota bacterium]